MKVETILLLYLTILYFVNLDSDNSFIPSRRFLYFMMIFFSAEQLIGIRRASLSYLVVCRSDQKFGALQDLFNV